MILFYKTTILVAFLELKIIYRWCTMGSIWWLSQIFFLIQKDFISFTYTYIYIWNSINELFDISLLLNFFFPKKTPVQVGSLEQWTCRHCTLGSIWWLSLIFFIWIGGICDLSNWMHDIGIWCFPPNSFFF